MDAEDLDKLFDSGEVDITPYLDLAEGERPDEESELLLRINHKRMSKWWA